MFYRKMKKFCFVVGFFIWIIIKNYWCDVKSVKKIKMFFIWFFWEEWNGNWKFYNGLPNSSNKKWHFAGSCVSCGAFGEMRKHRILRSVNFPDEVSFFTFCQ
jgi:hypothetical protein